jgi:hypothetical protein
MNDQWTMNPKGEITASPVGPPFASPLWSDLQGYYVIKYMKIFQSNHLVIISCLIFTICYIFVWIGHWAGELIHNSSSEIITVIFMIANSLYILRTLWGLYFIRSLSRDPITYQLLLKCHQSNINLQKIINIIFVMNLIVIFSLRFGECIGFYQEIAIWLFYFPMTIFHDIITMFTLTLSLFLIISQQGALQLFMSQLRFNLSPIFYDGKLFVSQEFLRESPFPSPPSQQSLSFSNSLHDHERTALDLSSTLNSSASSSSILITGPQNEYEIFILFSQHYLTLHSTFHYLTVTYGKYFFFLISSMLCTIVYLILYIYAYDGASSTSSLIESLCSLYIIMILMFSLAKVNVFGRHVQTLITRKCLHLLTTNQVNPFSQLSTSFLTSMATTSSPLLPSPSLGTLPPSFSSSLPPDPESAGGSPPPFSPTERMIFYHQINGFLSSLSLLRISFGFTRYFVLDYNGLSALMLSLLLSLLPRLLSKHIRE